MFASKNNRKNKKYFRYVGVVFLTLGICLTLTSGFIIFSPYVFGRSIISPLPAPVGAKVENSDLKSLLSKAKIDFSSIYTASDSSYLVNLSDGGQVIFSKMKDYSSQVRSLQIVLSRLTIDGKKLKSLDFRFDKPVVSY